MGNDFEAGKFAGEISTSLRELKEGQKEHKVKLEELQDDFQKMELRMGKVVTFEKCAEMRQKPRSIWPRTVAGWMLLVIGFVTIIGTTLTVGSYMTRVGNMVDNSALTENVDGK